MTETLLVRDYPTLFDTGYTVLTYRIRRKDGEYVWLESSIKLLNGIHSMNQDKLQYLVTLVNENWLNKASRSKRNLTASFYH